MLWILVIFASILSQTPRNVNPPNIFPHQDYKISQILWKTLVVLINTPKVLDNEQQVSYTVHIHQWSTIMSVAYSQAQKQKYRVTLELDVLNDFDPHNMDWAKVFKLEPAEHCEAYVEDLSTPDSW